VPSFLGESDDLKPKGGKDMNERYFFIHNNMNFLF
jgi:hypothetical protein